MKKLIGILLIGMISGSIWLLSCSKRNHDDDCGPFPNKFKSTGLLVYTLRVESLANYSYTYDPANRISRSVVNGNSSQAGSDRISMPYLMSREISTYTYY